MDSEGLIITQARAKIDAEILALEERIRSLRHERNRLAPISRLPPEVILVMFTWLQQGYLGHLYSSTDFPSDYPKWALVTHISQNWRQIALSSRSLWNVIPVLYRDLSYATESLKRLGPAPFFLISNNTYYYAEKGPLWEMVATRCHQLRFVRGVGESVANFKEPTPLLEYLELTSRCSLFPSVITHSLHTIKLTQCDFSWDWPALPLLKTLHIWDPVKRVSLGAFIQIMHRSPRLNDLLVKNVFSPSSVSETAEIQSSSLLPSLSSFSASGPLSLELFSQMKFTAGFSLDLGLGDITPASLLVCVNRIHSTLVEFGQTIRRFHLYSGHGDRYQSFWYLSLPEASGQSLVKVSFKPWQDESDLQPFLRGLSVLFDQVEGVLIDIIEESATWRGTGLGQLPKLRVLHLGENGKPFLEHIADDYAEFKDSRGGKPLSFISLKEMKMNELEFRSDLKSRLIAALAGRENAGYEFKKIIAGSCSITQDSKKRLQRYLQIVLQSRYA